MSVYEDQTEGGVLQVKAWNDENGKPVTRIGLRTNRMWAMVLEPDDRDELIRMLTEAKEHTG